MQQTWRLYAVGFATMAALMIIIGVALFALTLSRPNITGSATENDWLIRSGVAVGLGVLAAGFSVWAWLRSRRQTE